MSYSDAETNEYRFRYLTEKELSARPNESIKSIMFDIGRHGHNRHIIEFEEVMSVKTAIEEAEVFLSAPITDDYLETIKEDLLGDTIDEAKTYIKYRGDALGDCRFIEKLKLKADGTLYMICGS